MIQYFKNIDGQTVEIEKPDLGVWVNLVPPFKEEEFIELSDALDIPIEFLRDSLDIDERPRYEVEDNVKFLVIKTPTENNSFNDSDAYYITIPICIIITHNHIITVNSFDNGAIKKFLNSFQKSQPNKRNLMVLKILEKVVQNFMEFLKEINHRRNHFENSLYEKNKSEDILNLMRIQKSLVYFNSALRTNELLMRKLERINFLGLNEDERAFLDDLIVDTSQALEMVNIYSNILTNTLDSYASVINNSLNWVMKRFTAIIILISLPALVASTYSMGLHIGIANSTGIFYGITILSLIISVIISWYFIKKKWF